MFQDVRHGIRLLWRQRGFSALAVMTLALGMGASTAIFSLIDASLLHPLPYPHPEQLVGIGLSRNERTRVAPSLNDVRAWNDARVAVSPVAIERSVFPDRIFDAGAPERVVSVNVSESYFPLYGVVPAEGRLFTAEDMRPGAPTTIVLSHGFWRSRFGADRSAVGRTVRFDGEPATIIGVLPPSFGRATPVWRALQVPGARVDARGSGWRVIGRLRNEGDLGAAEDQLFANLSRGGNLPIAGVRLRSMLADTRSGYTTIVTVLAGAVSLIVLIACANVAGLLLARGTTRQAELAIRVSIGAGRGRLVRQLLTESLVLSLAGWLAGLVLAWLTLDLIVANLPIGLPGDVPAHLNGFVLGATGLLAAINALLFGCIPAIRLSSAPAAPVAARARHAGAALSRRGGQSFIAIEVALAVVMMAGAGLMLRSFSKLVSVDLGFDPDGFLTLKAEPADPTVADAYYRALLQRIRGMPDVEAAGATDNAPLGGAMMMSAFGPPGRDAQMVSLQTTTPGYFEAAGIPLRAGRTFTEADAAEPGAIILSESAARLFFPNESPLGRQLERIGNPPVPAHVVGVVANVRNWGPAADDPDPAVYAVLPKLRLERQGQPLTLIIRPRSDAARLPARLRAAASEIGPAVVVDGVRRGSDWLGDRIQLSRHRTVLLDLLGGLGLLLALVGVFGMTSYAVARRTREIGIRVALGARSGEVVGAVLRDAAVPIVVGVLAGTGGAFFATAVIKSFLFKTSPTDPATLVAVAVLLAVAGLVAAWIPARRAAKIDPVVALREG